MSTVDEPTRVGVRSRQPAQALIEKVLADHATTPPRGALRRLAGAHPFDRDTRPWFLGALGEIELAQQLRHLPPSGYAVTTLDAAEEARITALVQCGVS